MSNSKNLEGKAIQSLSKLDSIRPRLEVKLPQNEKWDKVDMKSR